MIGCLYCGKRDALEYRRIQGWERKSPTASRRSGSDIVRREPVRNGRGEVWACRFCIERMTRGLNVGQESLG